MRKDYTISIQKRLGYGRYLINVWNCKKWESEGTFETTDATLADDITEMNKDGFESELINFDTFDEIISHCLKILNFRKD